MTPPPTPRRSPSEWAMDKAKVAIGYRDSGKNKDFVQTYGVMDCLNNIAIALDKAVQDEREAAAKVCEGLHNGLGVHEHDCYQVRHDLARYIRNRQDGG